MSKNPIVSVCCFDRQSVNAQGYTDASCRGFRFVTKRVAGFELLLLIAGKWQVAVNFRTKFAGNQDNKQQRSWQQGTTNKRQERAAVLRCRVRPLQKWWCNEWSKKELIKLRRGATDAGPSIYVYYLDINYANISKIFCDYLPSTRKPKRSSIAVRREECLLSAPVQVYLHPLPDRLAHVNPNLHRRRRCQGRQHRLLRLPIIMCRHQHLCTYQCIRQEDWAGRYLVLSWSSCRSGSPDYITDYLSLFHHSKPTK